MGLAGYASSLTPIPEEMACKRDWHMVHYWEDQFCRDIYRDSRRYQEMHLRAAAMILPGTTPQVCPVDSIVNSSSKREHLNEVKLDLLDPCVWKYVLIHESFAQVRQSARSDVIGTWEINSTTFASGYYYQVKIAVNGCEVKAALSKSKQTYSGLQQNPSSHPINQTRILLLPSDAVPITPAAFHVLKKQCMQPKGATKA